MSSILLSYFVLYFVDFAKLMIIVVKLVVWSRHRAKGFYVHEKTLWTIFFIEPWYESERHGFLESGSMVAATSKRRSRYGKRRHRSNQHYRNTNPSSTSSGTRNLVFIEDDCSAKPP